METTKDMGTSQLSMAVNGWSDVDIDKLIELSRNNAISASHLIQQTAVNTRQLGELTDAVGDLANRMDRREQSEMISPSQKNVIQRCVNGRVCKLLGLKKKGGKLTPSSKKVSKVYGSLFYSRLYSNLNMRFGTSVYAEIRAIDFDDAKSFIETWSPFDGVEDLKREAEENWCCNHPELPLSEFLSDDSNTPRIPFAG